MSANSGAREGAPLGLLWRKECGGRAVESVFGREASLGGIAAFILHPLGQLRNTHMSKRGLYGDWKGEMIKLPIEVAHARRISIGDGQDGLSGSTRTLQQFQR